jgi:flagellin-specific chaperone FliS
MPFDSKGNSSATPLQNPQQRAANAYKSNAYQGMSEREMMAQLFQKIINHLYLARDAQMAGNLEFMVEQSAKAIHVMDVLREELLGSDALKDAEAAPAATFLLQTYTQAIERIANVLQATPPHEEFNAIIEMMKPIYQAWLPPKGAPEADATVISTNVSG